MWPRPTFIFCIPQNTFTTKMHKIFKNQSNFKRFKRYWGSTKNLLYNYLKMIQLKKMHNFYMLQMHNSSIFNITDILKKNTVNLILKFKCTSNINQNTNFLSIFYPNNFTCMVFHASLNWKIFFQWVMLFKIHKQNLFFFKLPCNKNKIWISN